jgi:uncharacterized protein YyaL (SSP411 family)
MKIFPKKHGSIRIEVDPDTGRDITGKGDPGHVGWQFMHKYNDDFTSLALLRAYLLTWKNKYLEAVRRYLDWVLRQQQARSGAFGKPTVNSAAASLIVELLDMARITRENKYLEACTKSVDHFLSLQELKRKDKRVHGGFYGIAGAYAHGRRTSLNTRTGAYALAALLKLEARRKYLGYTA